MTNIYQMGLPRRVIGGAGSISQLSALAKDSGAKNIVILTDKGVYGTGITAKAEKILSDYNTKIVKDVPPEPEYNQVLNIYNKVKNDNFDMIVAIGGGSVMDTAKILAVLFTNPAYAEDILNPSLIKNRGIATVFIPTTAGTGSEATPNSIVVVPEKELKVGIVNSNFIPDYVILDAEMTLKLPQSVTASTGVDAFCHAIECFISKKANPFSDMYALKAISLISKSIRNAYNNGEDISAREDMLLAAFYGGMCIASSSTVAVHALSYPLGGKYRIPHGISNAILLPYVMEYNADYVEDKFKDVALAMGIDIKNKNCNEISKEVINEIFKMTEDIKIPRDLKKFGITKDDLENLVEGASGVTRLLDNNPKPMTKDDMRNIYLKIV
ncbi:iron-containing alcohol dehydrogenase [Tepidanaerobacter sp. GT38]|uniref:iron-containing alcohol dehydrogenase n=1 Tax=Tepidanaerobacter sp. GT38 TaxID=2722793 RepID=UPI001F1796CD|nr:iron-containing alcohol dehydrogenase [Tepidanaerobacter sp. GT38]MCG1013088.1 iron-containing alcohol dehydrogenase [Tepidanaerobacter sp. GT38]